MIKEIMEPDDISKMILHRALEFRKYCLQIDTKELEAVFDIGKLLGMKLQIRFVYKKDKQ